MKLALGLALTLSLLTPGLAQAVTAKPTAPSQAVIKAAEKHTKTVVLSGPYLEKVTVPFEKIAKLPKPLLDRRGAFARKEVKNITDFYGTLQFKVDGQSLYALAYSNSKDNTMLIEYYSTTGATVGKGALQMKNEVATKRTFTPAK
jgi:hypothetical protein